MNILLIIIVLILLVHKFNLDHLDHHSEKFYQNNKNYKSVKDILHHMVPHISALEYAPDILTVLVFAYMMIMKYQLFNQYFGFLITIMLVREFVVRLTVLPKNKLCKIQHQNTLRGGCYDKIFSGHFANVFLMTLLLYDNQLIHTLIAIVINLVNMIFIILSRAHYTIDIVVSIMVVTIIYQNNLNIYEYLNKCF
jgi:hypothetical protein